MKLRGVKEEEEEEEGEGEEEDDGECKRFIRYSPAAIPRYLMSSTGHSRCTCIPCIIKLFNSINIDRQTDREA